MFSYFYFYFFGHKFLSNDKKQTFVTYNQFSHKLSVFTIWVISLLCIINDFTFKAYHCLCHVSFFIEAEWNTLNWYWGSHLYYKKVYSFILAQYSYRIHWIGWCCNTDKPKLVTNSGWPIYQRDYIKLVCPLWT